MQQRAYKAVFFDLDGTLLPMDMDEFLKRYFGLIGNYAYERGFEPQGFMKALFAGTKAMTEQTGGYNDQRFWGTFCELMGQPREDLEPILDEFYDTSFNDLGMDVTPAREAAYVLNALHMKGYRLYLTTMPLFPRNAVENRLIWAGCMPGVFERLTTYDNSTATKPSLAYYQENVDAIGLAPEEILMVGNNTQEDMAAIQLGLDGYLVTDWLLNPNDFDIETVKHGTLAEFATFVDDLPFCSTGADAASAGVVSTEAEAGHN